MPVHGEERNRRLETTYGKPMTLVAADYGETVYSGPSSSSTSTVSEVYCAGCDAWKEMRGIMGFFRKLAGCPDCGTEWEEC